MKNTSSKIVTGCLLIASFALNSFGQAPMTSIEQGGKMPVKIEKKEVPKVVMDNYIIDCPMTTNESWYGYPAFVDESDWFGYDPYLYTTTYPAYYIVEFEKEGVPQKVIYSKSGKKIATHKVFKTDLPKAVSVAIGKSKYKTWMFVKDNEMMFKHSNKMNVYKVIVEKGTEKRALYFQEDGKLIKDKELKS